MWIIFALLAALAAVVLSKAGLKNLDASVAFAVFFLKKNLPGK